LETTIVNIVIIMAGHSIDLVLPATPAYGYQSWLRQTGWL
jgi:hypothetical protein